MEFDAAVLHSQLAKLSPYGSASSLDCLQQNTSENAQEDGEGAGLLHSLLQLLDSSVQELRDQLDSCHRLLQLKPCMQDHVDIIRYAHTLRNAFAPLGQAPGLIQVPPAPQLPFMLCSTLRTYNMELARQQQQVVAMQQQSELVTQQQSKPGEQLLLAPGSAADVAAAATIQQQAQQVQQQPEVAAAMPSVPAIQFLLNEDLLEDELGSQVEEDFSEEDYSDD